MNLPCPLCKTESTFFEEVKTRMYYKCPKCFGIFLSKENYMNSEDEKKHYEYHNNDVEDKGYQNFVSPITNSILNDFNDSHKGLDFGAGTGSAVSKVLKDNNYSIKQYDPFFHNHKELLEKKYNYIASCEVVEHFHHPDEEFKLLKSLLEENGKLYIMTHLYSPEIDFASWYYIKDHTHVFIYQKETMQWIAKQYEFSLVEIENRLIIFTN